jgi:hypothetical protein
MKGSARPLTLKRLLPDTGFTNSQKLKRDNAHEEMHKMKANYLFNLAPKKDYEPIYDLGKKSELAMDTIYSNILQPKWASKKTTVVEQSNKILGIIENTNDVTWETILSEDTRGLSGDVIMRRLNYVLDNIPGIIRHEFQIQFHNEIITALLQKIYEKEWVSNSTNIMKTYGIKKYQPERFICTPRRFGKTMATIFFIIGALYTIPNINICIFSTGRRTSSKLKAGVVKFLRTMPCFDKLCTKNDAEILTYTFGYGDERTISCYPGTVAVCIIRGRIFCRCLNIFTTNHPHPFVSMGFRKHGHQEKRMG